MTEKRSRPIAILVLGMVHIFLAFRGIWNLLHQDMAMQALRHVSQWSAQGAMTAIFLSMGFIIGVGLIELKRWAFFISIAWTTLYFISNLLAAAYVQMLVSAAVVGTLYCCRVAFLGGTEERSANQAL